MDVTDSIRELWDFQGAVRFAMEDATDPHELQVLQKFDSDVTALSIGGLPNAEAVEDLVLRMREMQRVAHENAARRAPRSFDDFQAASEAAYKAEVAAFLDLFCRTEALGHSVVAEAVIDAACVDGWVGDAEALASCERTGLASPAAVQLLERMREDVAPRTLEEAYAGSLQVQGVGVSLLDQLAAGMQPGDAKVVKNTAGVRLIVADTRDGLWLAQVDDAANTSRILARAYNARVYGPPFYDNKGVVRKVCFRDRVPVYVEDAQGDTKRVALSGPKVRDAKSLARFVESWLGDLDPSFVEQDSGWRGLLLQA